MGCRNLTDAAYPPRRGGSDSTVIRTQRVTGEALLVGGVVSPLLSNIYLTEVDRMLERAQEATRYGKYTFLASGAQLHIFAS
jgi:retron-type reverse transcriptase